MEYLKGCATNVQAIGDIETIQYRIYYVKEKDNAPKGLLQDALRNLQTAESSLRDDSKLVSKDTDRSALWWFDIKIEHDNEPERSMAISGSMRDGYEMAGFIIGDLKATDLARIPARSSNQATATHSRHAHSTNGRPVPASATGSATVDQRHPEIPVIYEYFMAAIIGSLSHRLNEEVDVVPINSRTFIYSPALEGGAEFAASSTYVITLEASWTSSSTLLVSWSLLENPRLIPLSTVTSLEETLGTEVLLRIAPSGAIASLVKSEATPSVNGSPEPNEGERRKRPRFGHTSETITGWKHSVEKWLHSFGVRLRGLEEDSNWVKIRLGRDNKAGTEPSRNTALQLLWPKVLCFAYDLQDELAQHRSHSTTRVNYSSASKSYQGNYRDRGLDGFLTKDSLCLDSLESAQQWFTSKPKRDSDRVDIAQPRETDSALSMPFPSDTPIGVSPASPLYLRAGIIGELQPGGGVYPTPPDGILVQGNTVASSSDPGANNTVSNMTATGQSDPPFSSQSTGRDVSSNPLIASQGVTANLDMPDSADELFEDADEDVYTGNHVTDEDFSFFDEPDEDDVVDAMDIDIAADVSKQQSDEHLESHFPSKQSNVDDVDMLPLTSNHQATENSTASVNDEKEHTAANSHTDSNKAIIPLPMPANNLKDRSAFIAISPNRSPSPILNTGKSTFLETSIEDAKTPDSRRKESVFDPVSFDRKLKLSDTKYSSGRFQFSTISQGVKEANPVSDPPNIRAGKSVLVSKSEAVDPRPQSSPREAPTITLGMFVTEISEDSDDVSLWSVDDASASDDGSQVGDDEVHTIDSVPTHKRKRTTDNNSTPMSLISPVDIGSYGDHRETVRDFRNTETDPANLFILEPTPWDWSLAEYTAPSTILSKTISWLATHDRQSTVQSPSPNHTDTIEKTAKPPNYEPSSDFTKKDTISIAQVFSEQVITSTLDLLHADRVDSGTDSDNNKFAMQSPIAEIIAVLRGVVKKRFASAVDCNLSKFALISDPLPELPQSSKSQQQRPLARRTNTAVGSDNAGINGPNIFQISPPHIRVRRADCLWDFLPPALSFWEPLGLAPVSESKNCMGYCIYPDIDNVHSCVKTFLDNISLAYEGCKLGTHYRGVLAGPFEDGLVPCKVSEQDTIETALRAYRDICVELGSALSSLEVGNPEEERTLRQVNTIVIYIVNPFESPKALWELCAAFWSLFRLYGPGPDLECNNGMHVDIVLQIIPMQSIASADAPVILEPNVMAQLAREVYDRCPPNGPSGDRSPLQIFSGPSIQLEETLPRHISFRTVAEPAADILRENSHMHVGYSISLDGSWLTAAWTDIFGKYQACASYCLNNGRSLAEVIREVWQTTLEIILKRRVTWRICLARAGVMEREEVDLWSSLAMQPFPPNLCTALLSVNTNAPLSLYPTSAFSNPPAASNAAGLTTPVGTPQPGVSPDPHGATPAATPSDLAQDAVNDPDARLVDTTDETWGVILAHRANNSNSIVDFRPSLVSGIIIKRGTDVVSGASREITSDASPPGPIVMGVNLLWLGAVQPQRNGSATPVSSPLAHDNGAPSVPPNPTDRPHLGLTCAITQNQRGTAEAFLKEIISQYRGLGLLAKLKGMRGTKGGTIPWHVCAAMRSVEALEKSVQI